jgi:hypothetical protein
MAIRKDGYYYNQQLRTYILQFMAIFSGLQVMTGKTLSRDEALIDVPIRYGAPDRVVASILAGNTQNAPLRLPLLSAYMSGLDLDTSHFHGLRTERRNTYVPTGGLVPNDMTVIKQRMPLQMLMQMELNMYASNTDQHFQMIEQIMPLFDPSLMIQTSDSPFDMTRLTSVTYKSAQIDGPRPIGTDRRIVQHTLNFEMPVYLSIPAEVHKEFVEKIFIRIGNVSTTAVDSYDIIAELDAQNIPYDLQQDDSNLKID